MLKDLNLELENGVLNYMEKFVKPSEKAFKRYLEILEIIKGDDIAENLMDNLLEKAIRYVTVICQNEHKLRIQKFRLEPEDYRQLAEEIDQQRKRAHDALISALHSFNRYIIKEYEETPIGGIFSFDPDLIRNRVAVADWAMTLILSLFEQRKKWEGTLSCKS